MAKRVFSCAGATFTAVADTTTIGNQSFMNFKGGSSTQMASIIEISVSGQASASTIANALFARNSTAGSGTTTALASPFADGLFNNSGSALSTAFVTQTQFGTTNPSRSAVTTDARLNLSLNGFGGIYRWVAAPGEEWWIVGTGNSVESSFSLTTASGGVNCALGVHIVYEPI